MAWGGGDSKRKGLLILLSSFLFIVYSMGERNKIEDGDLYEYEDKCMKSEDEN